MIQNALPSTTISGVTTGISVVSAGTATGPLYSNGSYIVVNTTKLRKPRRPQQKRQVPLFSAGLEAKLNKNLDVDASKIIRYITRKLEQQPTLTSSIGEDVYEFQTMFTYVIQNQNVFTSASVNQTISSFPYDKHITKFYARLVVRNDGTLCDYEIRLGGSKR